MNIGLNLEDNLIKKVNIRICKLQKQLYTKTIWGCYNNIGIKVSKLRLSLIAMFPFQNKDLNLEFINITNHNFQINEEDNISEFILEVKIIQYANINDIVYIIHIIDIYSPIMRLPRLNYYYTITINGLQKVLLAQFRKHPGISFEYNNNSDNDNDNDNDNIIINLPTSNKSNLYIAINKSIVKVMYNNHIGDLLQILWTMGLKHCHILSVIANIRKIVYYKGKWYNFIYNELKIKNNKYGLRKLLRHTKSLLNIYKDRKYIIINSSNMKTINVNNEVISNKYTALNYDNILDVILFPNALVYNKKLYNNYENEITRNDINAVNLTYTGRYLFNYIIHYNTNYGMDLLTKRDLLLIWYKSINDTSKFINTNIKILKGTGDLIIEIIENILIKTLNIIKANSKVKNLSWERKLSIQKKVQANVDKIFNTSNLCQYTDQVNCLSELSHKNRLTCINERNLSSQTAEVNVRNIYKWHFGKICPIESPEGRNIGLVSTLASYASISSNGHIITGYYKVYNGLISKNIIYLNYYEGKRYYITLFNNIDKQTITLNKNKAYMFNSNTITLYLPSYRQIFSYTTNLIPFLSHNDPTRALMAANMQRQAIPLITPQAPLIGTGNESLIMANTHYNVITRSNSIVINVDSTKIVIYEINYNRYKIYLLSKPNKSNQETCLRLRTSVDYSQILNPGDIIAECQSSDNGNISLGANLLVAFMCWKGFNYEDSILISENIVSNGILNSLHIIELETRIHETKFGKEWLTNDLKMVPIEHYWYLPRDGIVKNGWIVCENNILVGKLSPNFHTNDFQVNKERYNKDNVKDTSLRVPIGITLASVLEVHKIYSSEKLETKSSYEEYIINANIIIKRYVKKWYTLTSQMFQTTLYANTHVLSKNKAIQYGLKKLYRNYINDLKQLEKRIFKKFGNNLTANDSTYQHTLESIRIKLLIRKSIQTGDKICGRHGNKGVISKIVPKQDMPFMSDGTIVDIVLNPLGVPSRMNIGQILETNLGLISYKFGMEFKQILWVYENSDNKEYIFNIILSKVYEIYPNITALSFDKILSLIHNLANGINISCPLFNTTIDKLMKELNKRVSLSNFNGKLQLYDGRTGLPFNSKSTVGIMYILKLNHLIDSKIHVRNTGPYSLITQQPLKGKTNKGGQRLGEMEVWALQGYGAVNIIKEALTVKCDDVIARNILHENILNIQSSFKTSWNESLLVLLRELFAMCINIELK